MRRAAACALAVCVSATGCGDSERGAGAGPSKRHRLERAIAAGRVLGVGSAGRGMRAQCRRDPTIPTFQVAGTGSVDVFQCRTGDASRPIFLSCQILAARRRPVCAIEGAPQDVRLFTTPELRAAPKDVTWKCEDEDAEGRPIGPVFVSLRDRPQYPAEQLEWMTKREAEAVARAHHTRLGVDC